jgi:CHASE2 domain-containing sensor protein
VNPAPVKVFCCYSHKDRALRDQLHTHLAGVERDGRIEFWDDRQISPGTDWSKEISNKLEECELFLLLISPDFVASDYCIGVEMRRAFERSKTETARVIPIVLRPFLWRGAVFNKLQALPPGGSPVTKWPNPDDAFQAIASSIDGIASEMAARRSETPADTPIPHDPAPTLLLEGLLTRRHSPLPSAFALASAMLLGVAIQLAIGSLSPAGSHAQISWAQALLDPVWWIQRHSFGTVDRPTNATAVITIGAGDPDEVQQNACAARLYVARLLDRLRPARPRVVAIDYWFNEATCPAADEGTRELQRAISDNDQAGIPVAIALHTLDHKTFRRLIEPDLQLVAAGQIDFRPGRSSVTRGLARFNRDLQMLPVTWPTYATERDFEAGHSEQIPSLSLVAARLYDGTLSDDPLLTQMLAERAHPLTTLIPLGRIPRFTSISVLCGGPGDWRTCTPGTSHDPFGGRAVFIGDDAPESPDYFTTLAGTGPGVLLHANYLLSLLDRRFFAPVHGSILIAEAAAMALAVALLFLRFRFRPELALTLSLAVCAAIGAGVILLANANRQFVPIWLPWLPAASALYALRKFGIILWSQPAPASRPAANGPLPAPRG